MHILSSIPVFVVESIYRLPCCHILIAKSLAQNQCTRSHSATDKFLAHCQVSPCVLPSNECLFLIHNTCAGISFSFEITKCMVRIPIGYECCNMF